MPPSVLLLWLLQVFRLQYLQNLTPRPRKVTLDILVGGRPAHKVHADLNGEEIQRSKEGRGTSAVNSTEPSEKRNIAVGLLDNSDLARCTARCR